MADKKPPSPLGETAPLVTPLYQSSVYTLPDLDALDRVLNDGEPGFIYARDAHPNARLLAQKLAHLESAPWAAICSSGMAAISAIVLATVQKGQRIVASNRLYGRTVQLFEQELSRFGVATEFVDCNDLDAVEKALSIPTRMLFVETISNPLLRVVDVPALVKLARKANCLLVVDNTFASPVLLRPLEIGADFVMESLTKIMGGHSDVTLGLVCGSDPDGALAMQRTSSIWGLSSNPFDCWLAERGLETLPLRMHAASQNAGRLADWLTQMPGIRAVHYPGLPEHPDHELACDLLQGGFGHMLCFELEGGRDAVNAFMHHARAIPFSPSLGHTTTTMSHPGTTSHRYVSPAEKRRQGITDGLVRLSVGIEDLAMIQREIEKGLKGID